MPKLNICAFRELTAEQRLSAEIAIVANPNPAELAALPNLQWVQSLWAGVERLLTEVPQSDLKIVRMNDPQLAASMAEAVLAWSLYLHRDMPAYKKQQSAKIWKQHTTPLTADRTVSILGLGSLGLCAANRLTANGFSVFGWSRSEVNLEGIKTFNGEADLHALLSRTDILVVLLPLTMATSGLLNEQTLALLPRGASVINFARGPILDETALINHLDSGHLAHAVLDVFSEEPLPKSNPLWTHADVTVLPHISARTNKITASKIASGNISSFLQTGEIPQSVSRKHGY
jgi:glyoxylate/hydroxypyruvate reductase